MKHTLSTKELTDELEDYQSGNMDYDFPDDPPGRQVATKSSSGTNAASGKEKGKIGITSDAFFTMQRRMSNPVTRDTREAITAGFGDSKYDTDFQVGKDLEDARAREQSAGRQFLFGVAKGGVTAAATFANTLAGTFWGLGKGVAGWFREGEENEDSFFNRVVSNEISEFTNDVMQLSEKVMPNYRTAEERTEEYQNHWYYPSHIFTANFLADNLIKNFGFTVGAIGAGYIAGGALASLMRNRGASKLIKGLSAAAKGDKEAQELVSRAADAIKRGTAVTANDERLLPLLETAAKRQNVKQVITTGITGILSASGEALAEGTMARDEFLKDFTEKVKKDFIEKYDSLEEELLASKDSRYVTNETVTYRDGQEIEIPVLTEAGKTELLNRQKKATEEYNKLMQAADAESYSLATNVYVMNMPLLFFDDLFQFGRLLSGGWKTSRKINSAIKGKISAAKAGEGRLSLSSDFTPKTSRAWRGAKVMAAEAGEEMFQGGFSSGSKRMAEDRLSGFNDDGYDKDTKNKIANSIYSFLEGAGEYYSDPKNWQEGFMGAVTGAISHVSGASRGEKRAEVNAARKASADRLNNLIKSKEFQDRWQGFVRHMKYDEDMKNAMAKDDEYAWKTADQKQLVSDIITFANEGRLNDLMDIVDAYGSMTVEDAEELKKALSNGKDKTLDWISKGNYTDEQIVDSVKKRAQDMKDTIEQYRALYDSLSALAPQGSSEAFMNEMVSTAMNINKFEKRFFDLFGEVFNGVYQNVNGQKVQITAGLDDLVQFGAIFKKENGVTTVASDAEQIRATKEYIDNMERLFAGSLLPTFRDLISKKELNQLKSFISGLNEKALAGEKITLDKKTLLGKIDDLEKLNNARKQYFQKLATLQEPGGQKKFDETAKTPEKEQEKAQKEELNQEMQGLDSLVKVREYYNKEKKTGKKEQQAAIGNLRKIRDTNKNVDEFLKIYDFVEGFRTYLRGKGYVVSNDMLVNEAMVANMVTDMLDNASSVEDIKKAEKRIFTGWTDFYNREKDAFGPPLASTYENLRSGLAQAIKDYMKEEEATKSRSAVTTTKNQTEQNPSVDTPEGYDPSNPSSTVMPPIKGEENPVEPAKAEEPAEKKEDDYFTIEDEEDEQAVEKEGEQNNAAAMDTPEDPGEQEDDFKHKVIDRSGEDVYDYMRTSIPEVDPKEATEIRNLLYDLRNTPREDVGRRNEILKQLESKNIRPFVESHPEFSMIWNALQSRDASMNLVNAKAGDSMVFMIDPTFPDYDGRVQILVAVDRKGQSPAVISTLTEQEYEYYGVRDLREAINKEFAEWTKTHDRDKETFIFSKKSKITKKLGGVGVIYNRESPRRSIKTLSGFESSAPILYVGRDGIVRNARTGEVYTGVGIRGISLRKGSLYYLAKNKDAENVIPVRLGVAHLNADTVNNKDYEEKINDIKNVLSRIEDLVKKTTKENAEEQDDKLRPLMEELGDLLAIPDIFFEIGVYSNIVSSGEKFQNIMTGQSSEGPALKITTGYRSKEQRDRDAERGEETDNNEKNTFIRPDQMTSGRLLDFFIEQDKPFQVKEKYNEHNKTRNLPTLDKAIDDNIILTDADALYTRGTDVRMMPYIKENNDFGNVKNDDIDEVEKELQKAIEEQQAIIEGVNEFKAEKEDEEFDENDDDFFSENENPSEKMTVDREEVKEVSKKPTNLSTEDTEKMFDSYNKGQNAAALSSVARKVFSVAKSLGLKISVVPGTNFPKGKAGRYSKSGVVEYNADYLNSNRISDEKKANLLLHEMIHAVTVYALNMYEADPKSLSPELRKAMKIFNKVYDKIKGDKRFEGLNAAKNVREMVASLGDSSFRELLRRRGLWQKILDGIKQFFGITAKDDLDIIEDALDEALSSFDTVLYKTYRNVSRLNSDNDFLNNTVNEKELQDIKQKAIANGTFMKAPNGKPTNLSEKQWLQVRTKAFKDWFGDWESVARLDAEYNAEGITNKEYAFNGEDFINKLIKSEKWSEIAAVLKKKMQNLSDIKFYYADFNTLTPGVYGHDNIIYLNRKHTSPKNQLHEFIHAITAIEYKNNLEFKKQIDELYLLAANDSLWGKRSLQNHIFYSENIYGYNSPEEFLAEAFSNRDFANILQRIPYDKKESVWQKFTNILRNLFGLHKENTVFDAVINSIFEYSKVNDSIRNNASKVVDENGEPLVVYTGVPTTEKFSEFKFDTRDRSSLTYKLKKGIYFSDEGTASLYAIGPTVYDNPLDEEIVKYGPDNDGTDFNDKELFLFNHPNISEKHYNKLVDRVNEVRNDPNNPTGEFYPVSARKTEGSVVPAFLNIKNPVRTDLNGNSIAIISNSDIEKINNSEGAIIENVNEQNRGIEANTYSTDYIVFNPNQIKSATDNSGEFSTEDNNIYYMTEEADPVLQRVNANINVQADKMSDLTEETQTALKNNGFTEESFDSLPDMIKERILDCL